MTSFLDSALAPDAVPRALGGDVAAQEAIYRAFERPVFTLARRLVPQRAVAEDLAQDVFVEVLTRLAQYDGRGSFAGWVRAIAVNRCLMHLRSPWHRSRRWFERATTDEDAESQLPDESAREPADALDLERALARLSDTARAVVWLHGDCRPGAEDYRGRVEHVRTGDLVHFESIAELLAFFVRVTGGEPGAT